MIIRSNDEQPSNPQPLVDGFLSFQTHVWRTVLGVGYRSPSVHQYPTHVSVISVDLCWFLVRRNQPVYSRQE